jgi:thioredoxin-related protein
MKKPLIITIVFLLSLYSQFILADHKSATDTVIYRPSIVQINSLPQLADIVQHHQLPVLLLFSTENCPYCEQIKEEFLIPMLISGDYKNKVIIRELNVADDNYIIDFSGRKISSHEFSRRYKVNLFPTTSFINHKGNPLTKNIIGINTPSLFGGTLDDHIDVALRLIRGQSPLLR